MLAIGMVAILVWSARDVGLLPGQWAALIIATILVAGLAVWIIGPVTGLPYAASHVGLPYWAGAKV